MVSKLTERKQKENEHHIATTSANNKISDTELFARMGIKVQQAN